LIRTRGLPLLVARLWIENVLKLQCLNWKLYPRIESLCPDGFEYYFVDEVFVVDREFGLAPE
jgi:hypothetical protein